MLIAEKNNHITKINIHTSIIYPYVPSLACFIWMHDIIFRNVETKKATLDPQQHHKPGVHKPSNE